MKKFVLSLLACAACFGIQAMSVSGNVYCGKTPLSDVIVSDGKNFAVTDSLGNYTIEADENAKFIFTVTPSGYVATCKTGTPCFYKPIDARSHDFELFRYGTPGGRYALLAIADTQPVDDVALERLSLESIPDIKATADAFIEDQCTPVYAVILGDVTYDAPDLYPAVKKEFRKLNFPVYTAMGNHDHDINIADERGASHIYNKYFGPENYAFQVGNDWVIVLDDILYKGNKQYAEGFDQDRIDFVRGLLEYVPKGSNLYMCMHAPYSFFDYDVKLARGQEMLDLFDGYNLTVLGGHHHINFSNQLRDNVHEYGVACVGGPVWLWDCDMCIDGTPNGYQVFVGENGNIDNRYKVVGKSDDYMFKVLPNGAIAGTDGMVCIKCWNIDSRWKAEWTEDGGKSWRTMETVDAEYDPEYVMYLQRKYLMGYPEVPGFKRPVGHPRSYRGFRPSAKAKVVDIRLTDPYGKVYTQTVEL